MKKIEFLSRALLGVFCLVVAASCGGNHQKPSGWRASDDVCIAVDETFRAIMEDELGSFGLLHPEAGIKPTFVSEDSAIRLLLIDSVRCIVATRRLSAEEQNYVKANANLGVKQAMIATDAFALVVNKSNPDSLISVEEIRKIVSGKITRWEQLRHSKKRGELQFVFDHSGSSTVRYMRDSLLDGRQVAGNVFAQGSNEAVLEAVRENPDVIGVVGANWLKAGVDSVINDFNALDVKVMQVCREDAPDALGWKPYQYRIHTGDYPLVRSVYVILTDPRVSSFTKTFFFFLKGQKGQTIICNDSQMLPYEAVQYKSVRAH